MHATVGRLEGDRLINLVQRVDAFATDSELADGLLQLRALGENDAKELLVFKEVIRINIDRILMDDKIRCNLQLELV